MKKEIIGPEDIIKFFEDTAGVRFVDAQTGKPVLETIATNKTKEEKSDYDIWLEQQDEDVRQEQEMGAL